MTATTSYQALTPDSLPGWLSSVVSLADRLGGSPDGWTVREVGDGNLNLVFIVAGPRGAMVVKQALPYVRLVGDSWPLPLYRAFYEHNALTRQAARDPGSVPEIYYFNNDMAIIAMEYLSPHVILRRKLIQGKRVQGLGSTLGLFCARTAFRGSELSMQSADKKADVALFAGNVEIPAITEALVFCDPYREAEMNHHTPGLEPYVAQMRSDVELKSRVQALFMAFASNTETMLHGDLHSGSVMATDTSIKVIDPEFAQYGPMGFDLGMLLANFLMAYFSQPGHRTADDLQDYQEWILTVIDDVIQTFRAEFMRLWNTERTGMLYSRSLFEDQGQSALPACEKVLNRLRTQGIGFCGIEMHRRVLSLAHNADFEEIEDPVLRADLESRNLSMGIELIKRAEQITRVDELLAIARSYNTRISG